MDLQKFGVKLFFNMNGSYSSKDFIPVFHTWIQENAVDDHLLVDVADYSHILDGPGIMLVAHEGNFSLDNENHQPGMLYMRKTEIEGNFNARFEKVLNTVIQAAKRLCDNNIHNEIDLIRNSFRFIANDRRLAENTAKNQKLYQNKIKEILLANYNESKIECGNISSENERLAFTLNLNSDINILKGNE